ncbi:MAG TPA: AbrB/MazE/SpoVT family DNA-binding domain-containing protein [Thermoanaerobaculia bacterium]|nr:AbrB/MazE/SpoVT family DNA-binding domain-containing protein [Thermoanaerobaculia bacterium]
MHGKIQRWGNSLAVRIPKAFALGVGFDEDTPVEISVSDGDLVISALPTPVYTLEQLLAGITDENLHEEVATGPPVGNEVW